jgi:hypothetical protein
VSLEPLQRRIAALLKVRRSPNAFVGGAAVLNERGARVSEDMDIYAEDRPIAEIAGDDLAAMTADGLVVVWRRDHYGFAIEAEISDGTVSTILEWSEADHERFFPAQPHPTFGWALHVIDLAVLKVIAAATRRQARDIWDLIDLTGRGYDLAALALAAPAKLPGIPPITLLERGRLTAVGLPAEDFDSLRWDRDEPRRTAGAIKLEYADLVQAAIDKLADSEPSAAPGLIFLDGLTGLPALPTAETRSRLEACAASRRGAFPRLTSPRSV